MWHALKGFGRVGGSVCPYISPLLPDLTLCLQPPRVRRTASLMVTRNRSTCSVKLSALHRVSLHPPSC